MILGMTLETFTLVHVIITLIGIATGLVVLLGMLGSHRLSGWTAVGMKKAAVAGGFLAKKV